MMVKQGIAEYKGTVGRGQLSAAYSGLGILCGIVAPLLWGSLYQCAHLLSQQQQRLQQTAQYHY
jgi:hypothetical protein